MAAANTSTANTPADPWSWLGLLKWSLSYSDGTKPTSATVMSDEDRAFLEKVMKEGIIDENERMKFILNKLTVALDYYQKLSTIKEEQEEEVEENNDQEQELSSPDLDELQDLLDELRDIVEQIDYARAFCSLKGIPFLLGCSAESTIPSEIRILCLGILATLCQNNPPVQKELLELGGLKTLSDLYFAIEEEKDKKDFDFMARIMQAMSAIVRNHEVAETVFTQLPQASTLFESGLNPFRNEKEQQQCQRLRQRTLFFVRALLTSDISNMERITTFQSCLAMILDHYLQMESSSELREISLAMLEQLLDRGFGYHAVISDRQQALVGLGVKRISTLRALTGEEREHAQVELDHWERILVLLSRATKSPPPQK